MVNVNLVGPYRLLAKPLVLPPRLEKPPASGDPARGLVAWWKLDEADGAEAADASGHHFAGHIQGAPHWAPGQGRIGGALDLDGTRSFVDCGDAVDFSCRDRLTVSLWFKSRSARKGNQTLIAKGNDSWSLSTAGEKGHLVFALNGPETTGKDKHKMPWVTSKEGVDDGQWHHVAGVYDGEHVSLYVDGALAGTVAASGPLTLNSEPVWLGNNPAARGLFFNGWLDDVRLYARGLSEEEVKTLHHDGAEAGGGAK